MNITQHTPGTWLIREGDEWTCDIVTKEGINVNGDQMYWTVASYNRIRDEAEANAKLIAAAPEMLALLQESKDLLFSITKPLDIEAAKLIDRIDEILER